jgi:hypothetical protein
VERESAKKRANKSLVLAITPQSRENVKQSSLRDHPMGARAIVAG